MSEREYEEFRGGNEVRTFLTLDPSYTKDSKSDYTAFVVADTDSENHLYVRHVIKQRLSMVEMIEMLFKLVAAYEPQRVGIQHIDWTKSLKVPVMQEMRRLNQFFKVIPLATYSQQRGMFNKKARIERLSPRYAQGMIIHVGPQPELELELLAHPRSKNDDVADATSMMLDLVWPAPKRRGKRTYPKFLDEARINPISGY
jgi:predicted phage terminase large subunit-like protein